MDVSVIIPTYNRRSSLERLLQSLADQDYPKDRYEVIVVDDGSDDGMPEMLTEQRLPYRVIYDWQTHRGVNAARNRGIELAKGSLLIFLDDDMRADSRLIEEHVLIHAQFPRIIVKGDVRMPTELEAHKTTHRIARGRPDESELGLPVQGGFISFQHVGAGHLSIAREHADRIRWDETMQTYGFRDLDFVYRAHKSGLQAYYHPRAVTYHYDYAAGDLAKSCARSQKAAWTASAVLFNKHPELEGQIPMFRDKGYIALGVDPPGLVVRKVLRTAISWGPALWALERLTRVIEVCCPRPAVLRPLYRWVIGGYIFRGYRQGLRERAAGERRKEQSC